MYNIFHAWQQLFTQPHMPVEEQRKRGFLALFLGILVLTLTIVGLLNSLDGKVTLPGLVVWLGVALALLSLPLVRYLKNIEPVFRLGFAISLAILTYETASGAGTGMAFLWFYFFPIATFFMFGKTEGLLWGFFSWVIVVGLLMFNIGTYSYPFLIGLRFLITYTLVCILSYGLESSRSHYYNRLLFEKRALEAALQQVKTLHGLLPICASCKKIRDDTGYWHQVESYLSQHMEVTFSHGVCPECRLHLYPKFTADTDAVAQNSE
jgi:hypothetical protein